MRVVFRADASTAGGTGHVVRCLTLAGTLVERGATVSFVSGELPGNLNDLIVDRGFAVTRLPAAGPEARGAHVPDEAASPATAWRKDAELTLQAIERAGARPDWLVVDHYGLDVGWERALTGSVDHIMVVDDLANRPHDCDLLLDQNYDNPLHRRYAQLVPKRTRQLLGTHYALVRAQFREQRPSALARRNGGRSRLLVSMGGTDPRNDTIRALAGLKLHAPSNIAVDVIVGRGNPHQHEIRRLCNRVDGAELHIQTDHMAELMARADIAITAGGSTTWERCVVGLPALVVIQSADQVAIAKALGDIGAHRVLGLSRELEAVQYARALDTLLPVDLLRMSAVCSSLCDGAGADRVADHMFNWG